MPLHWVTMKYRDGIYADVGDGLGRYTIYRLSSGMRELRLNSEPITVLADEQAAKDRAELGAATLRSAQEELKGGQ